MPAASMNSMSPERPPSTTILASQSRIHRLKRESSANTNNKANGNGTRNLSTTSQKTAQQEQPSSPSSPSSPPTGRIQNTSRSNIHNRILQHRRPLHRPTNSVGDAAPSLANHNNNNKQSNNNPSREQSAISPPRNVMKMTPVIRNSPNRRPRGTVAARWQNHGKNIHHTHGENKETTATATSKTTTSPTAAATTRNSWQKTRNTRQQQVYRPYGAFRTTNKSSTTATAREHEESDPDGPLLPRQKATNDNDTTTNTLTATERFEAKRDKIQKVQRRRIIATTTDRKVDAPSSEEVATTRATGTQQEQQHLSTTATSVSAPQQLSPPPAEDDITLTSVRQIVDTNHHKPPPRLWMPDPAPTNTQHQHQHHPLQPRVTHSFSSDYETDESAYDRRNATEALQNPSGLSASAMTPDVATYFEQKQQQHRHSDDDDDDDDDFDTYQDDDDIDDDDSQASLTYQQRRARQEKATRRSAVAAAKAEMDGPFVQHKDVEHYRKSLDTPVARTAAVVVGAAALGCVVLGPVGLLVGAAAVGIGAGAMQIPEEQRNKMIQSAQDSAVQAGDVLSHTCVNTYRDSGIAEHVPQEVQSCCPGLVLEEDGLGVSLAENASVVTDSDPSRKQQQHQQQQQQNKSKGERREQEVESSRVATSPITGFGRNRRKKGKVACLREGPIIPVAQIHALSPADQPRAWLDVLASAETTHDERVEAMEEVLILAKDKQRARIFVEEGILDSLMWTLGRYFEKSKDAGANNWAHPNVSKEEHATSRLAATCCLTLGKAYCAAMHTEGDLLLMSLYERGTVPEERQLAQMLHEVPHHVRVTKTDDPTIVEPSKEVFALRQMSLPQAEELSISIKALVDGKL